MPKQYRHCKVTTITTAYPMDGKVGSTCDIVRRVGKYFFSPVCSSQSSTRPSPPACPIAPRYLSDSHGAQEQTPVAPSALDKLSHAHQYVPFFLFLFY